MKHTVTIGPIPEPTNYNQILILNPIGTPSMHRVVDSYTRSMTWENVKSDDRDHVFLILEPTFDAVVVEGGFEV